MEAVSLGVQECVDLSADLTEYIITKINENRVCLGLKGTPERWHWVSHTCIRALQSDGIGSHIHVLGHSRAMALGLTYMY